MFDCPTPPSPTTYIFRKQDPQDGIAWCNVENRNGSSEQIIKIKGDWMPTEMLASQKNFQTPTNYRLKYILAGLVIFAFLFLTSFLFLMSKAPPRVPMLLE